MSHDNFYEIFWQVLFGFQHPPTIPDFIPDILVPGLGWVGMMRTILTTVCKWNQDKSSTICQYKCISIPHTVLKSGQVGIINPIPAGTSRYVNNY